jgi:MFS family permease
VLIVVGMFGWFFFSALYLQRVLGFSTLQTGLAFLPATLMLGVLSIGLSAKIAAILGERLAFCLGTGLGAIGLLMFARVPADGDFLTDILPAQLMLGIGIGTAFMPIFLVMMSEVPPQLSGLASGVLQTAQQFGGAVGLALLTALAATRTGGDMDDTANTAALLDGYHLTFLIGAISLGLAVVIAAILLPTRAAPPVQHEGAPAAH